MQRKNKAAIEKELKSIDATYKSTIEQLKNEKSLSRIQELKRDCTRLINERFKLEKKIINDQFKRDVFKTLK